MSAVVPSCRLLSARLAVLALAWAVAGCEDDPPPRPVIELLEQRKPEPVVELPPEVVDDTAVVVALVGKVEVRRGDREWDDAKVGDRIAANDALRTAEDANVQMQVGEARVTVREKSDIRVNRIEKGALRARVASGHIEAKVTEGSKASVEMETDGSDTVVKTTGGEFFMTSDGHGIVAVATKSGVATLRVAGRDVELKAGEQGRVVDDKVEREAMRELLLAVQWPGQRETNKTMIPVEGKAPVGSRVMVQGQVIRVDKKGRFRTKVALKHGKQHVAVRVTDVHGRFQEEAADFVVDRKNFLKAERPDWGSSN